MRELLHWGPHCSSKLASSNQTVRHFQKQNYSFFWMPSSWAIRWFWKRVKWCLMTTPSPSFQVVYSTIWNNVPQRKEKDFEHCFRVFFFPCKKEPVIPERKKRALLLEKAPLSRKLLAVDQARMDLKSQQGQALFRRKALRCSRWLIREVLTLLLPKAVVYVW